MTSQQSPGGGSPPPMQPGQVDMKCCWQGCGWRGDGGHAHGCMLLPGSSGRCRRQQAAGNQAHQREVALQVVCQAQLAVPGRRIVVAAAAWQGWRGRLWDRERQGRCCREERPNGMLAQQGREARREEENKQKEKRACTSCQPGSSPQTQRVQPCSPAAHPAWHTCWCRGHSGCWQYPTASREGRRPWRRAPRRRPPRCCCCPRR